MGLLPLVCGFLVLSYYSVVAGWTLFYAHEALIDGFSGKSPEEFTQGFQAFSSDPLMPVFWTALVIAITCGIVALGVQKGIERGSKIMMPLLFVFILVLVGCSLTLPGAGQGLEFLFKPDFSMVDGSVALSAMGQAFFSLSVGIGCLCTYACYFRKDTDLMKNGLSVASIDTLVALFSGLIIPQLFHLAGDAAGHLAVAVPPAVFVVVAFLLILIDVIQRGLLVCKFLVKDGVGAGSPEIIVIVSGVGNDSHVLHNVGSPFVFVL